MKKKSLKNDQKKLLHFLKSFRVIDIIGISIFFIIVATAAVFFLRRQKSVDVVLRVSEASSIDIWYKPPIWYLDNLKPGMTEKDWTGQNTISIKDINTTETNQINRIFYVTLSVQAAYEKNHNQYIYNGIPLLVGSYQTFKLQGVQITGIVTQVGEEISARPKKDFVVTGYLDPVSNDSSSLVANSIGNGVQKFLADKFTTGLQVKNNKGEVVAEIQEVTKTPATRQIAYQDKFIEVTDPEKEHVAMKVKLTGEKFENLYLFLNETPILVNAVVPLDFNSFGASFIITDINSEN